MLGLLVSEFGRLACWCLSLGVWLVCVCAALPRGDL